MKRILCNLLGVLLALNGFAAQQPNIILILTDDQDYYDLGYHGNPDIDTPVLDRFASESLKMHRFYVSPLCSPTRASLLTGRYHQRTGILHTSRGATRLAKDEVTIAEILSRAGYRTGIFGKWHLGDNYPMRPQDQGFDETLIHQSGRLGQVPDYPNTYINPKLWDNGQYVQKQGYCTDLFFDAAHSFIEKHKDHPFFVYLPTNIAHADKHVGLEVPQKYSAPYIAKGFDKNIATVCGMLNNFDENFGRLLARLDTLNLRDKTVVIFLSDDGNVRINKGNLRGQGYATPYEGSLKVPCFIQWTGHFTGGLKVDRIASHIDILPTLLDITGSGISSDTGLDGVSLLPLLEDQAGHWADRMLFLQCERGMTPHRYKNSAVIAEKFKMVGYPNTFEERGLVTSRDKPELELYDIASDPGETTNLAEQYPEELKKLRDAYDLWFDDVKASRQFLPGVIHIGAPADNPTYLCRYQDATYINKKPAGWPVFIERQGNYEVTINRGESLGKGLLCIQYDSTCMTKPLSQGENQAIFSLPEGKAHLNIWVEEEGKKYEPRSNEDLIGDVLINQLTK